MPLVLPEAPPAPAETAAVETVTGY